MQHHAAGMLQHRPAQPHGVHAACCSMCPCPSPPTSYNHVAWARTRQVPSTRAPSNQLLVCGGRKPKASDAASAGDDAAGGGDADASVPSPAPRKARKPKQDKEVSAEAVEAEVKPKRTRRSKAVAALQPEEQEQAGPAAADELEEATAEAQPEHEPQFVSEAPEAEWTDSATSVLSESLKRRGRPRVMDEYAPPASPLEAQEDDAEAEQATIISPEVIEALKTIEPPEWQVVLREEEAPTNWAEEVYAEAKITQRFWEARRVESKAIEEEAWKSHHHQNRYAENRYLTVRRVARIMAEVENHDFMREDKAPQHIPSWARAEMIFRDEFDEFNEYTKDMLDKMGRRRQQMEEEEEARERMEHLDLLVPASSSSSSSDRVKMDQASTEARLMEDYLDNILPGATLSSMSEAFADDIFSADADVDEEDAITAGEGTAQEAAPPAKLMS